jgi:hypothetical protein
MGFYPLVMNSHVAVDVFDHKINHIVDCAISVQHFPLDRRILGWRVDILREQLRQGDNIIEISV